MNETARQRSIWVVDDTPANIGFLLETLSEAGYRVRVAPDGESALEQMQYMPPDLILLDVMMPKLSGFEVCRRLRADPATRDIAILMVTALDQATDVETAVEVGTDDFVTKPINKTELQHRVRVMLDSRSQPNDIERTLAYLGRVQAGL